MEASFFHKHFVFLRTVDILRHSDVIVQGARTGVSPYGIERCLWAVFLSNLNGVTIWKVLVHTAQ